MPSRDSCPVCGGETVALCRFKVESRAPSAGATSRFHTSHSAMVMVLPPAATDT